RLHLENVDRPVLPYFGLFLRDVTFILDGNDDHATSSSSSISFSHLGLNMEKISLIAKVFERFYYFQEIPFTQPVKEQDLYFLQAAVRKNPVTEDGLYERSLAVQSYNITKSTWLDTSGNN